MLYSIGRPMMEKTQTSVIGGRRIKEKKGKLSSDLGKPAMKATETELQSYVDAAKSPVEKKKRVARVNLMKAHKAGLRAQGAKVPSPRKGKVSEGLVVVPKRYFR